VHYWVVASLVLALRYATGVVLASDGQSTDDAAGQPTRSDARKLFHAGRRIAWGAAGSDGLRQTVAALLDPADLWTPDAQLVRERLVARVLPVQAAGVREHVPHAGTDPPELDLLFAWHDGHRGRILTVPRSGSGHRFHNRFAAIGSGDIFAVFAFRSLGGRELPALDLEHAKLLAYKAVLDAIDVAAVYLGPPIQMSVVDRHGVRAVPREELDTSLLDAVEVWRARQREALAPPRPAITERSARRDAR